MPTRTSGIEVRIAISLPHLTIDAARVELVPVNLISNPIKYALKADLRVESTLGEGTTFILELPSCAES